MLPIQYHHHFTPIPLHIHIMHTHIRIMDTRIMHIHIGIMVTHIRIIIGGIGILVVTGIKREHPSCFYHLHGTVPYVRFHLPSHFKML